MAPLGSVLSKNFFFIKNTRTGRGGSKPNYGSRGPDFESPLGAELFSDFHLSFIIIIIHITKVSINMSLGEVHFFMIVKLKPMYRKRMPSCAAKGSKNDGME